VDALSGAETYEDLLQSVAKAARTGGGSTLSRGAKLKDLRVADKVFQWRLPGYNVLQSDNHVFELARVLKDHRKGLDPILVFPVDRRLYVIDGHHRLAAYRTVKWDRNVPVRVFKGSLDEARIEALAANIKDKLPMTCLDKQEAAWRLVKAEHHTKSQIANLTTVSDRQIGYMRKTWRSLNEHAEYNKRAHEISWREARNILRPVNDDFDVEGWRDREARKLCDALLKAGIGQGMGKRPDVTALAIEMLSPELPSALVEAWMQNDRNWIVDLVKGYMHPDPEDPIFQF
jgi:ParB-like chromosome segregation protein Spo0J